MKRKCICKIAAACMLSICMMGMLAGCGNKDKVGNRKSTTESLFTTESDDSQTATTEKTDSTEESTAVATSSDSSTTEAIFLDNLASGPQTEYEEPIGEADPNVDVDLTVLTPNMIYAEVYNMMTRPEEYMGKTIKVKGEYSPLFYDVTGNYYHYVLIKDAAACCQSGIEFIWDDNSHTYPDEYPAEGQEIIIQGTFGSYIEDEGEQQYIYYYLAIDEITLAE